MVELRSGDVEAADRKRETTAVPGAARAIMNRLAACNRRFASGNKHRAGSGVVLLQRAGALGCCLWATVASAGAAYLPDVAGTALPGALQPPSLVGGNVTGPPDAATTLRVFAIVEAFVRGTGGGLLWGEQPVPPVHGCAVVLRLGGEIVGRGSSIGLPGSAPTAARIAEATEAAWEEVERRVPASVKPEAQAARAERMKRMRQEVLISLELSGAPLQIGAAGYGDFDGTLQPGMDGLLAVMEGKTGVVFPSAALAGNVMPSDCARRAVSAAATAARGEAGGGSVVSLTEPGELEKKHGVTLYRFRATHVAQWQADKRPELLYRGQELVLQNDVDGVEELWRMADRLAENLCNRMTVTPRGGDLSLPLGTAEEADAFGLALARHALIEYRERRTLGGRLTRGVDDKADALMERAMEAAQGYLSIARERVKRAEEKDKLAASAVIVRNYDAKSAPEFPVVNGLVSADGALARSVPAGLRGLVIWGDSDPFRGMGSPADDGKLRDPSSFHPSERAVRKLMAETAVPSLPSEMPWLGWADLEVDRHLKRPAGQKSGSLLREMRTLVWKHQLQAIDAGPDAQDMAGGIVVPGGGNRLPTWQTARLVAFLGTMLGEPELTSKGERGGEIVKLLGAARYLRQLQVDDTTGWMCKDPVTVKGGLRNATWDQRTQTDATAMGLLAVLEIIGGIERASKE